MDPASVLPSVISSFSVFVPLDVVLSTGKLFFLLFRPVPVHLHLFGPCRAAVKRGRFDPPICRSESPKKSERAREVEKVVNRVTICTSVPKKLPGRQVRRATCLFAFNGNLRLSRYGLPLDYAVDQLTSALANRLLDIRTTRTTHHHYKEF